MTGGEYVVLRHSVEAMCCCLLLLRPQIRCHQLILRRREGLVHGHSKEERLLENMKRLTSVTLMLNNSWLLIVHGTAVCFLFGKRCPGEITIIEGCRGRKCSVTDRTVERKDGTVRFGMSTMVVVLSAENEREEP